MAEPESRFFESSRLRLHYSVWGDESKPPLILQHGNRDHGRSWDFVAQALIDSYSVYAPDLRGHGDSDWAVGGAYLVCDFVADFAHLVEVLDRGPVYIVGHSLGGRVATDFAATFPDQVKCLIAIEGFGRFHAPLPASRRLAEYVADIREREQSEVRYYRTLEEACERMQEANRRLSPAMVRHLTEYAVRRLEDGTYVWKFDDFNRLRAATEWTLEETNEIWQHVTAPTLHIGGSDSWGRGRMDQGVDRISLATAIPDSRSIILENAGHWVHHDQFDKVVALIREFFS